MTKDEVFKNEMEEIKEFKFNEDVANCFDDMLSRSIPFYDEIHRIITDILDRAFIDGKKIYDLGCSTGTTINIISDHLKKSGKTSNFIGVDNSGPMIKKCQEKMNANNVKNVELICDDIENVEINNADMIIMNYTLQFIDVEKRLGLLKNIFNGLNKGGVFIFSEKINCDTKSVDGLFTELYYDFKRRNGYSELEIAQKREALENVLRPLAPDQHISLLKIAGFDKVEILFRWYNFACFIGIK
jgi:tRNA (cmo5U34)-methyltransferase